MSFNQIGGPVRLGDMLQQDPFRVAMLQAQSHQNGHFSAQQQSLANLNGGLGQILNYQGQPPKILIDNDTKINVSLIKENKSMFKSFREFVASHRDIFFTVAVVLVVDHLVFKGKLKEKVHEILEKLLDKVSNQLESKNEKPN